MRVLAVLLLLLFRKIHIGLEVQTDAPTDLRV